MSDATINYCSTDKCKWMRDEKVSFDFGFKFDVTQKNVLTEHQVPESSETSDIEKFISNCSLYIKNCSFNFNKKFRIFQK